MWNFDCEVMAEQHREDLLRAAAERRRLAALPPLPRRNLIAPAWRALTRWCRAVVGRRQGQGDTPMPEHPARQGWPRQADEQGRPPGRFSAESR
jgi:hypothetical protein